MSPKLLRRHDHPGLAKHPPLAAPRLVVPAGHYEIVKALRAAQTRGHGMSAGEVDRLVRLLAQAPVIR